MTKSREEFETLFLILYKKWREWGKHTSAYGIGWDIWQAQQKKIDELEQQRDELIKRIEELNPLRGIEARFNQNMEADKCMIYNK